MRPSIVPALVTLFSTAFSAPALSGVTRELPPSSAYRLTLEKFMNGEDDLLVTFFVREGRPVHAWAIAPSIDQALHRIDLTPAAPIEYLLEGRKFVPGRDLKGDYDYKKDEFLRYRELYTQGKLTMRNINPPAPLAIDANTCSGTFDIFLDTPDHQKRDRFRVEVNLRRNGQTLTGRFVAFHYDRMDESFSPQGETFSGTARLVELRDHWKHAPDRAFAPGADWPQQHGPTLTGSAVDCQRELVDNLADARLLWIADLPIPAGRGGIPRSAFGFFPINNSGLGPTQYSAPIVANGKVYLAVPYPDEDLLARNPATKNHPQVIRGMDPRGLAHELGVLRDTLVCIDAQTGRTLWMFQDSRTGGLLGDGKSGRGLTAVFHDGKVIFRGQLSLYCVDAQNGKLIWQNDGVKAKKGEEPGYSFSQAQPWSTDHSPVLIDGVLVVRINDTPKPAKNAPPGPAEHSTLIAINPDDGKLLWRAPNVTGINAIPTQVVIGGKTYIVAAYQGEVDTADRLKDARPEQVGLLSLIEPKTGRIVWQQPVVGPNPIYPVTWNDIVALNVERERVQPDNKGKPELRPALGAFRITEQGPQPLWRHDDIDYQPGRATPIVHHGVIFTDSRLTGFQAIGAASGKVLGKFPHLYTMAAGSHNWTWTIASNDRILTSGDRLLMFRLRNGTVELMPGSLRVDLASGYTCPIRPAIADGRLFVRTSDGLACYDLRKPSGKHSVDTLQLRTDDLALGMAPGKAGVDLQLRLVNDQPNTLLLRFPAFQETGVARPYDWGQPSGLRWGSAAASHLLADGNHIRGQAWVRVNQHSEPWSFDLSLDANAIAGSVERHVPARTTPTARSGAIDGDVRQLTDGRTRYSLRLTQGAINESDMPTDVTLYLEQLPDGTRLSHAAGGRISQAAFELDGSSLRLDADRITGTATLIVHSDRFTHLHPEKTTALACTYELDARVDRQTGTLSGNYRGQIGVDYRRKVAVSGNRLAGHDAQVEINVPNDPSIPPPDEPADIR